MLNIVKKGQIMSLVSGKPDNPGPSHFSTLADNEGIKRCKEWAKHNGQFIISNKVTDLDQKEDGIALLEAIFFMFLGMFFAWGIFSVSLVIIYFAHKF